MYDEEEGFEEEGDEENTEMLEGKAALTPLWNYVINLKVEKVVEATSFCALMVVMEENHIVVHIPMFGGIFVG